MMVISFRVTGGCAYITTIYDCAFVINTYQVNLLNEHNLGIRKTPQTLVNKTQWTQNMYMLFSNFQSIWVFFVFCFFVCFYFCVFCGTQISGQSECSLCFLTKPLICACSFEHFCASRLRRDCAVCALIYDITSLIYAYLTNMYSWYCSQNNTCI